MLFSASCWLGASIYTYVIALGAHYTSHHKASLLHRSGAGAFEATALPRAGEVASASFSFIQAFTYLRYAFSAVAYASALAILGRTGNSLVGSMSARGGLRLLALSYDDLLRIRSFAQSGCKHRVTAPEAHAIYLFVIWDILRPISHISPEVTLHHVSPIRNFGRASYFRHRPLAPLSYFGLPGSHYFITWLLKLFRYCH